MCQEGLLCRDITLCPAAIAQVRSGSRPFICGWNRHVAKVCCPKDSRPGEEGPFPPGFIAFRRPAGENRSPAMHCLNGDSRYRCAFSFSGGFALFSYKIYSVDGIAKVQSAAIRVGPD